MGIETTDMEAMRRAIEAAHPNALRMAMYQATGDEAFARFRLVRNSVWGGTYEETTVAEEDLPRLRDLALAHLAAGRLTDSAPPSDAELRRLMELYAGGPVEDFVFDMGKEQLSFDEFPRGVEWESEPPAEAKAKFHVLIVGAGTAGLTAAVQLAKLGIDYTIIERNAEVGGTWHVNDYPDARVDTASHLYQLSYMQKYPWKHYYAVQPELKQYAEVIVDRFDLSSNILLETTLKSARWDEDGKVWHLVVEKNGEQSTLTGNAVISAAGLFNQANLPDIPGIRSFTGKMFHTTQWDHSFDFTGKRVAIIGVGSTGAQLMPAIARKAAHVSVFQRSPQWVGRRDGYRDPVSAEVQWLFDNVPNYWHWFCFTAFYTTADVDFLQMCDREWQRKGGLISERNDALREQLKDYVMEKVGHRPDLAKHLIPSFPPFAKRLIADNGWYDALLQDHVDLVTDGIESITATGICTADGQERDFDLIVLAGGFKTERYLWPVRYEGRGGQTLEEAWNEDGARAYLGLTVPGFPNLFIVYGPNAQARAVGLMSWLELWVRYAVKAITLMIEQDIAMLDCRPDVYQDYNQRMDEALRDSIWDVSGTKSYYINEHGRQSTNMPWHPGDYHRWIQRPDLADFDPDAPRSQSVASQARRR